MTVEYTPIKLYRSTDDHEAIIVGTSNYLDVVQWLRDRKIPFKVESNGDTMKVEVDGRTLVYNTAIVLNVRTRNVLIMMRSVFESIFVEVNTGEDKDPGD